MGKSVTESGTLMSRCESDFECSNSSFNENKLDGVDLNSNQVILTGTVTGVQSDIRRKVFAVLSTVK